MHDPVELETGGGEESPVFFGRALFPFGKDFSGPRGGAVGFVFNIIWLVFAGIWIFLSHIALAVPLAVSIIGIPFAFQHVKLAMLALAPFGVDVREKLD